MPSAKVFYFNWSKGSFEDESPQRKPETPPTMRATYAGEFLADRPDLYDYVYTYVMADLVPDVEDELWTKLNCYDRTITMPGKQIRSMSVGDVVLLPNGKAKLCKGQGWKDLDSLPEAFHKLVEVDRQEYR